MSLPTDYESAQGALEHLRALAARLDLDHPDADYQAQKPASSPTPRTNSPMTSACWGVGGEHVATLSRRIRRRGCRRPRPGSWPCGLPFTTPATPPTRP